ncbi:hypothetical protein [Chitinimonas koreensis]|uniref:hypothetical protein n=1 Tax=Chitinimonas koreensis TaxID=356302 RepID=UPI000428DB60|nr:hypothetical protein [Chitinimonas koreensis]QNM98011.1 hypothetical protein H9L41_07060 [Chitinimonas koreensis]
MSKRTPATIDRPSTPLLALMTAPVASAETYLKQMLHRRDVRRKIEDLRDRADQAKEPW